MPGPQTPCNGKRGIDHMGKAPCNECGRESPRSISNRCMYCGSILDETFRLSDKEMSDKLQMIEDQNNTERKSLEAEKEKAKQAKKNRGPSPDEFFLGD